jgi:hypothetical protein
VKNNFQDSTDDGGVWIIEKTLARLMQEKTGKIHED